MTAAEFSAWMEGRSLNDMTAAPLLAASQPEVTRWRNGARPIPRRIIRIIELLGDQPPQ